MDKEIEKVSSPVPEIRIGIGGNVDAGKSSFVGVLSKNVLDDGRGYARSLVMRYKHEIDTGRTSSIAQHHIQLPHKIIELTDLAGHEKYLRTTLNGISGLMLDYVAIIINCNVGIQQMTREHIVAAYTLKIPMFIVYTKIDMAPTNIYTANLDSITKFYKQKMNLNTELISTPEQLTQFISHYQYGSLQATVPIFPISNVTGSGIAILKMFINSLKQYIDYPAKYNNEVDFYISRNYKVKGVGLVVSGILRSGTVRKGDVLYIGPNCDGFIRDKNNVIVGETNAMSDNIANNYYKITIANIHDNFQNSIDELYAGQGGCFQIKFKNTTISRHKIKRGMHIVSEFNSVRQFKAKIKVMHNPSTITIKYQPTVHCAGISQSVQILEMDKEYLRSYDEANVKFKFMYKPEYIKTGDIFVFREGTTKGVGKVLEVF